MNAADPRYITHATDNDRGDVILPIHDVRKLLTMQHKAPEETAQLWLTTADVGYALEEEEGEVSCPTDDRQGKQITDIWPRFPGMQSRCKTIVNLAKRGRSMRIPLGRKCSTCIGDGENVSAYSARKKIWHGKNKPDAILKTSPESCHGNQTPSPMPS